MNPFNSFYWFKKATSTTLCDHIIRFAKEKENEKKLGLTESAGGAVSYTHLTLPTIYSV